MCYVSLVGFMFKNTRLLNIPIPFHTDFEEVNLRFYVKHFDGNEWKLYDSEYSLNWIVSTSDGRLWSQDRKLGLMEFDGQKWIRALDLKNSLLESATVKVVQVDSKGKILIGTDGVGVFKYDPVLNVLIDLKLGRINVHLIKEMSDESIWI